MSKLKLQDTRIKKIVEPDIILDIYKGLVNDYIKCLYSNHTNIKDTWMFEYYDEAYRKLIKECEEFTNNIYTLSIPFENACILYNNLSEEFDKLLYIIDNNTEFTKEIVNLDLELITLALHILKTIFK